MSKQMVTNMKKTLVFLILILVLLTGCNRAEAPQIAATTLPVYTFTSMLCEGTGITVGRIVTEEVSCLHDYTLQVSQMRMLQGAQVVVMNGGGLEDFLADALKSSQGLIDASAGIELHCPDEGEHSDHHHETDPHIWLSPQMARQMCINICSGLVKQFPEHAEQFRINLAALFLKFSDLIGYGYEQLYHLQTRELVTFHDGFGYFAEFFDLHILEALEEESGSEASAQELIELAGLVKEHNLPAIFIEKNGSTAAAEIIGAETGVAIFSLDMIMSGEDYFEAMYRNIDTVKEALG